MRAMVLHRQAPVEARPLVLEDFPIPEPKGGQVRIRVKVCGVCHTDLHEVEGDIHPPKLPMIPGHQVVGVIEALGPGVTSFKVAERVGVPWLYSTCGTCDFCRRGQENLCEYGKFTGFSVNGGYAEQIVVPADSAYPIPANYKDENAAPLLCAGVIGYRSFRLSGIRRGETVALFGFGGSAHIVLQLARARGCEVQVFTRSAGHKELARKLGASWVGSAEDRPSNLADAAIVFAPAGGLVPVALAAVRKGGTVALAGIAMSEIPSMSYELLYDERILRSVANSTHEDVREFLEIARDIKIETTVQSYPLEQANEALLALKNSHTEAAAVLRISF